METINFEQALTRHARRERRRQTIGALLMLPVLLLIAVLLLNFTDIAAMLR